MKNKEEQLMMNANIFLYTAGGGVKEQLNSNIINFWD